MSKRSSFDVPFGSKMRSEIESKNEPKLYRFLDAFQDHKDPQDLPIYKDNLTRGLSSITEIDATPIGWGRFPSPQK